MMNDIKHSGNRNLTVIVTGGNRGIGEYITRAFFDQGYHVMIGSQTDTGLAKKLGNRARFLKTDVRHEEACHLLVQKTLEWTGHLDVYINCAGFSAWRSVDEVDEEFWDAMIDTNLKGVFFGCKAAARHLEKNGCIINISSIAGKRGSANNSVYCASKFGVNGVTQALAKELGPRGIRVNAVCPVYIATDGLVEALKDPRSPAQGMETKAYLKKFADENAALHRLPLGEEIANACLFLASDGASAITGQCINVDCGVHPQ
jgi:3-oxoacyl-[acyl-carrier protein] reductase/meso-butanediol dehydrogenase/(S,S)-butanediol dehydrogenase/diacetyl reductase